MAVVAGTVIVLSSRTAISHLLYTGASPMSWHVERETGLASEPKRCAVVSQNGEVLVRLSKDRVTDTAAWSVRVGVDNQPGSLRYLRIDKRYFQTDQPYFTGSEAVEIVALLNSRGEFAFEWARRPDYAKRAGLFGTGNFAAKASECERWICGTPV